MPAKDDAIGLLYLADVSNDRPDLLFGYMRLRRHIAKPPVVLARTTFDCAVKGGIAMVTRVIDRMQ